jgi:adenylosuccinate lyase
LVELGDFPVILGKEIAIFAVRLSRERKELSQVEILEKFAAAVVAYPDVNWLCIAQEFVQFLGLGFNPYVAQVCYQIFLIFISFCSILV